MNVGSLIIHLQAYDKSDAVHFDVLNARHPSPEIEHVYKSGPGLVTLQGPMPVEPFEPKGDAE